MNIDILKKSTDFKRISINEVEFRFADKTISLKRIAVGWTVVLEISFNGRVVDNATTAEGKASFAKAMELAYAQEENERMAVREENLTFIRVSGFFDKPSAA